MANGGLPYSLTKSKFGRIYSMIPAVVVAGSSDEHLVGQQVAPSSILKNANGETVALQYATSQSFYFKGHSQGIVIQIVTDGEIDIDDIATSIDGVNFDTLAGFSSNDGMTSSHTYRIGGVAPEEYVKIDITRVSGNYYVNVLGGGDR